MHERTIRSIVALFALALVGATFALAQSSNSAQVATVPTQSSNAGSWQVARQAGPSRGKLVVVTLDQPTRRQTCRIQSFTKDKLVCSGAIGGSRTYLPQQVLALILPGNNSLRTLWLLGFNGGLGAAIWGTVVLAAACPACAVGTGIAALFFLGEAGVTLFADGEPDRLLYLSPGEKLTGKLRFVQPL